VSYDAIVIVGAGHAALQLCVGLVEAGQGHRVTLVGDEFLLPYQRPPLSKSFLKKADEQRQLLREPSWFEAAGIQLILGDAAESIDRHAASVTLRSGRTLAYARLVLATGARARRMPNWPDGLSNVHVVRSLADAHALREGLSKASSVTVLGGGFIGLEAAATCAALGKRVQVLEAGPRLMGRAVSNNLSAHAQAHHVANGIGFELQTVVQAVDLAQGRLCRLITHESSYEIDLLLLAIGAQPNTELANAAGLNCDDGILVDAQMQTSDPRILAVGDCTRFVWGSALLRLESIQNAQDQARIAVMNLLGKAVPGYSPVPRFWSEQGSLRLQMVGLLGAEPPISVRRQASQAGAFSLFHYHEGRLCCVESVNAPADYMMARKLLEAGLSPDPANVADTAIPLRTFLPS
jgi:3-phenylpropionate/trans-cinnamate dioxygenase ferredoxin reductase subunit